MMTNKLNNILLVSGSGRNCGKTTLACELIQQLAKTDAVYGLKITPHFHITGSKQRLVSKGDGFKIYREFDQGSGKDTSRMLNAGAVEVYFLQCTDTSLKSAYAGVEKIIPSHAAVVCESGSLADVFQPGIHILVRGEKVDIFKKSYRSNLARANAVLTTADILKKEIPFEIGFNQTTFRFKRKDDDKVRRSA